MIFAFGAGVLATVNPCGFAMLPAFFGYTDEPHELHEPDELSAF